MGEQIKLLASAVIEIDDAFIMKIKKELKKDDLQDNDVLWDVDMIASIAKIRPATVRQHIKNHIYNIDGRKLKAEKHGKSWLAKKEDVEEYLNVKL